MDRKGKTRTLFIPNNVIDAATQRLFVVSFFVLVQAYKLYDLVVLKAVVPVAGAYTNQQLGFVIKYFLLDGLFLWSLPVLNIPLLTFLPLTVLCQTMALLTLTLFLASSMALPFSGIFLSLWKLFFDREVTIAGDSVNPSDVYDYAAHFRGRHTVKFLPDSSARLNPFNDRFCFADEPVYVPIQFNASEVAFVQVQHTSFSNQVTLLNYTNAEILRWTRDTAHLQDQADEDSVFYLELPISEPGHYRLKQVLDPKQFGVKLYRHDLFVPECPSVRFSLVRWGTKCIHTDDDMAVAVSGVPPFTVQYSVSINGQTETFPPQIIPPEDLPPLDRSQMKDIAWGKLVRMEVPLGYHIVKPGKHAIVISRLVDGFGNSFDFNVRSRDPEIYYGFTAYDVPTVSLVDPLGLPILVGGEKKLLVDVAGGFRKGDAPYTAEMAYIHEDPALSYNFTQQFVNTNSLVVSKPGKYILRNVHTKYCGAFVGKAEVLVKLVPKPTVAIAAAPIIDRCVGTTGYTFDFNFTGSAPYEVDYLVNKLVHGEEVPVSFQTIRSPELHHIVEYQPKNAGDYIIYFSALRDKFYRKITPLDRELHTYKTYFTKKSRAVFGKTHYDVCHNRTAVVLVALEGSAPFALSYQITNPKGQVKSYAEKGITANTFEIQTPLLAQSGDYQVEITNAKDKSGCDVEFSGAARIRVKPAVPHLTFKKQEKIKIVEGSEVVVPLSAKSIQDLSYSLNGKINKLVDGAKGFTVRQNGMYKLLGYKQSDCPGTASGSITVEYYPKPDMRATNVTSMGPSQWLADSFCQHCERTFDVVLSGTAPFTVEYELIHPSGKTEHLVEVVTSNAFTFGMASAESGRYEYSFTGVYDFYYTKSAMRSVAPAFDPFSVSYTVNALPDAHLGTKTYRFQTCQGNIGSPELLNPVPLTVQGAAPFDVTLKITHNTGNSEERVLQVSSLEHSMYDVYNGLDMGSHVVTIVQVVDGNGCVSTGFSEFNNVVITITEVPKIERVTSREHYCVGDHVSYEFFGVSPFAIYYTFDSVPQRAEVSKSFTRLASKPGELAVMAISDSSSACLVNFTKPELREQFESLKLYVHPLPSVIVSQGEYVVEDIYEGDQAEVLFTFEGTPPFTLTYTRTVEADRKHRKPRIFETETINDIWEYEHIILTSLQGTYEAIEVADAFCVARNHK
ncbi:hypothetical protein BABINDRAFT_159730 [Babjeviella inositovora NRRL Y-12698]|uniref:Nucleoporin POM152 n=1 Tax=Babjeviella inositovora NRRL Y-12698 TaxID=984486 RepID=A0A1E3QWR4_9ASCO|nr:uncharacterized protein BABINDRAFT_159730 [Babjeviella inositovora NRRL Y-12698]ODQ81437.1 hypothetical protein BABINDRAFT_159730 [Babjeviella inositovora NRRL Y-12698]